MTLRPRIVPLLEMCIQDGIEAGIARAHKHQDNPSIQLIAQRIEASILERIHEWFIIDQGEPGE